MPPRVEPQLVWFVLYCNCIFDSSCCIPVSNIPPTQENNTLLIVTCCGDARCQERQTYASRILPIPDPSLHAIESPTPPLIFRIFSPPPNPFDCCIMLGVLFEYSCVNVCLFWHQINQIYAEAPTTASSGPMVTDQHKWPPPAGSTIQNRIRKRHSSRWDGL